MAAVEKEAEGKKSILCCFGDHHRRIDFAGMKDLKERV